MKVSIRTSRPADNEAVISLFYSLKHSGQFRERDSVELTRPQSGDMGAELTVAVIDLVLGTGFNLTTLAMELAKWRDESGPAAAALVVESNDRSTTLSLDDLEGPDEDFAVRRALVGAPDPLHSNVVLIGVSQYGQLTSLPGVEKNLEELEEVLLDSAVWGVPASRLTTVRYPHDTATVLDAISAAARNAADTLLVYFAGHGRYVDGGGLALALPGAARDAIGPENQVVHWGDVAEIVGNAGSRRSIVWLDCCYSGLALPDATVRSEPPELLDAASVRGTYLFAATQSNGEAKAPDDDGCTAFTGELVRALREGVEPGPPREEFVSLNDVAGRVKTGLSGRALPEPGWHDPGYIGHLPQFRNTMKPDTDTDTEDEPPPPPPVPVPDRFSIPLRLAVKVAAVPILVIAALLAYWLVPGPTVSGLSLTGYCSALAPGGPSRFTIADDNCVQKVDLDAACDFQYGQPDLKARFTSPDANSAVCDNTSTGFTYQAGISDMKGYCATRTTVPAVVATADNPIYENVWLCQVPINTDLACNSQNNRIDLASRQEDNGEWSCHQAHVF